MKKSLLIAALAVFTMASCSKDEVVSVPQNEIQFAVVTDNATKAADVYCTNKLMSNFTVFAQDQAGAGYITGNGDNISYTDGTWSNTTATRYWPETDGASLDFYAVVNGIMTFTPNQTTVGKIASFTPEQVVASQKDLLYAVATDQTKANGKVNMNFRHALSQIEFRARNENSALYVEITEVKVGGVKKTGAYTLPNASTSTSFVNHTQNNNATPALTRGDWSFEADTTDYTVDVYPTTATENTIAPLYTSSAAAVPFNSSVNVSLTLSTDAATSATPARDFSKSMLLLPTTGLSAWSGSAPVDDNYDGTYLGVYCHFYNVADKDIPRKTNTVKIKEQWAYLPVTFNWEQGKKYIYTFVFTTSENGGKDPEGKDLLTPITFTVSVDDFEKGESKDITVSNPPVITDSTN